MKISEMVQEAHETAVQSGWWDDVEEGWVETSDAPVVLLCRLANVHGEVSEAVEAVRDGQLGTTFRESDGKPEGLGPELADVLIRVADLAGELGIDLEAEVERKMRFNKQRPYRHGGKLA